MLIKYTYIFIRLRMFEIEEYFELDFISIPRSWNYPALDGDLV